MNRVHSGFSEMEIEILTAIAIRVPFSLLEVMGAYDRLRSYDATIDAAKTARETLMSLNAVVDSMLVKRNVP